MKSNCSELRSFFIIHLVIITTVWPNKHIWLTVPVMGIFQGEGGIGLFITLDPKVLHVTFSYLLAYQLWGLFKIIIGCFIKLSVQAFQPL